MTRIRKGGFVFVTWIGDHSPRHVHVFKDDEVILKWNLEEWLPIEGRPTRRVLALLRSLRKVDRL